jgi:hypothetical protein
MIFSNLEAAERVILGLLAGANNLSAFNSRAYLTTRLPNIILDLRNAGLEIEIDFHKTSKGKRYGTYKLKNTKLNYKVAHDLLEYVQKKIAGR